AFRSDLAGLDPDRLAEALADLEETVAGELSRSGFAAEQTRLTRKLALRYAGQTHALMIAVPQGCVDHAVLADTVRAFGVEHERTYGHRATDEEPVEVVAIHVIGQGLFGGERGIPAPLPRDAVASRRRAYFGPEIGWRDTPVTSRSALQTPVTGPAIVE